MAGLFVFPLPATLAAAAEDAAANEAVRRWESLGYGMYLHHHLAKVYQQGRPEAVAAAVPAIEQWVRAAKEAGMKFVGLVVKHEDGFCLWDSPDYDRDVGSAQGKPDLLKTFVAACGKEKLLPGIHYSVGDHYSETGDIFKPPVSRLYFDLVLKQTRELHTAYPHRSTQRNQANLLLNVGPDQAGTIPKAQLQVLANLREFIARGDSTEGTPATQRPIQERLAELKKLYEQGLIDKATYEKKSKEILDSL